MPYVVRKTANGYCVYKDTGGETLGCHPSRAGARQQQKALYASERDAARLSSLALAEPTTPAQPKWYDDVNSSPGEPLGKWHGVLASEGIETGDGREFNPDALRWEEGPSGWPLRWAPEDVGAHGGARHVGWITSISRDGTDIPAEGTYFDPAFGEYLARAGRVGLSIDADDEAYEVQIPTDAMGPDDAPEPGQSYPSLTEKMLFTGARIRAVTAVDIPAFTSGYLVADSVEDPSITAAAEPDPVTHAGVLLAAADTGRWLMLQRSIAEGDDNAGLWEYPGGGIDDGETPLDGATREFAEEVGSGLPETARLHGSVDSGIYRLHVFVTPEENDVTLNERDTVNPDDPDGDNSEAVAWWAPEHVTTGGYHIRPEVQNTDWSAVQTLIDNPKEMTTMAVGGNTELPIAPVDTAWDGAGAGGRVLDKATKADGTLDVGIAGKAFLWRDPASDETDRGAYKLPVADIINGEIQIVPKGVSAAAGRLDQTQGLDKAAVGTRICSLYDQIKSSDASWDQPCPTAPAGAAGSDGSSFATGDVPATTPAAAEVGPPAADAATVKKAVDLLDQAATLHQGHMDGTVPVDDASQQQLMGLITQAEDTLDPESTTPAMVANWDEAPLVLTDADKAFLTTAQKDAQTQLDTLKAYLASTPDTGLTEWLADSIEEAADSISEIEAALNPAPDAAPTPEDAMVASAAPVAPPDEWFEAMEFDGPSPLTITADGRVFGHLATWNSCHRSEQYSRKGECVQPPSDPDAPLFHLGQVITASGRSLDVGRLTVGGGHADVRGSIRAAIEHYDDVSSVVAAVRVHEDEFGIGLYGAIVAGATPESVAALRLAPLSGDWRKERGKYRLVAAHAVVVPGFPVPRSLVASVTNEAFVTTGRVGSCTDCGGESVGQVPALVASAFREIVRETVVGMSVEMRESHSAELRALVASSDSSS